MMDIKKPIKGIDAEDLAPIEVKSPHHALAWVDLKRKAGPQLNL